MSSLNIVNKNIIVDEEFLSKHCIKYIPERRGKMFKSELSEMDKNKRVALSELGYDFGITKKQAEAVIWKLAADELKPAINQYINQGVK